MSKVAEVKIHLEANIAQIAPFLQVETRPEFAITDFEGQSYIIISNDGNEFIININGIDTKVGDFDKSKNFTIKNVKAVVFVPIDGKNGFLSFGDSYCDFAFLTKIAFAL